MHISQTPSSRAPIHRTTLRRRLQAQESLSPREMRKFDQTPGTTAQDLISVTAQERSREDRATLRNFAGSLLGSAATMALVGAAPVLAVGVAAVGLTLGAKAVVHSLRANSAAGLEDKLTAGLSQPTREELDLLPPPRPQLTREQLDALPPPQTPPWQPPTNAPQILTMI